MLFKIENDGSIRSQELTQNVGFQLRTPGPVTKGRKGWIGKIFILAFSLLVCMEGGARLVLSIEPLRRRAVGFDDASYRLQWIRLSGTSHTGTGPYSVYHPTRGWALKPDVRDMRVSDGTILNTNSRQLRGKTEYGYFRTPGKLRIALLGDSFTFGEQVVDDDTYARYLEAHLPNTEVLNFGVQGYGHDQMLIYLREEVAKYHPDVVIVGFVYLDIYRNIWSFFAYSKPRFKLVSGRLQLTNVPVPSPDHVLALEPYRPKALDMLFVLKEKLRWMLGKNEAAAREITRLLLDEIIVTTRSIGAVPVFVYLPVYDELEGRVGLLSRHVEEPQVVEREGYLQEYCQQRGILCAFLGPRFREEVKRGIDFNPTGHWNATAHTVAGQEITDFLVRNGLIQKGLASGQALAHRVGAN